MQLQEMTAVRRMLVLTFRTQLLLILPFPYRKLTSLPAQLLLAKLGKLLLPFTATAEGNVVGAQTIDLALTGTASAADFTGAIPTQITPTRWE